MELINNFANIAKNLSEKFRLSKSETSLYLLAFIYDALNLAEYREFMSAESHGISLIEDEVLDSNTFRSIKDSGLIKLESFSKYEIRSFTEYLIVEYLKSANISVLSLNFLSFIVDIATESALELHSPNDDEYTEWVIYLSNIKAGDIVIELLKKLNEKHISEGCGIVGNEPDKILNFLTEINYFIHDINENLLTTSGNSLTLLGDNYSIYGEVQIAISIPPFTNIHQQELQKLYKFIGSTEKIYFPELAYIELMLKRVSERGKVIAVVRNEFLSSRKSKVFREKYLKNDWIEKIIALPKEFVGYPMDISVIVFNKTKIKKGFVVFDGSEDKFETTKISIKEVSSNNADLRVAHYASKESKEVESILSKYPQDEVRKIKDLIDSWIAGFNYSPKNRIVENSSETLPYVRVKDLSNNDKDFTLNISKVERKISPEKVAHKRTVIDFSAVLISKIAPNLKPTLFNFTGQPIVIGSDVVALKVKKDVNVEYFLTQLYSQLVKKQVEMMSSGNTINRISNEDFLSIKIHLPLLEEQAKQVIEFLKKTQKELIEDVAEVEKEIKNTEYDVIRIAIHDFNQKLGAMQIDLSDLKKFFEEKLSNFLNEPIKPIFDDDTEEEINQFRLGNVLQRLINTRNEASAQLATTREELQNNTVKPVYIKNLKRWFEKEVKPLYENDINFQISGEKVEVEIDPNRFKNIVRNLIVNAKQHNAEIVAFDISYTYFDSEKKVSILYKNNGEPFPKDFDFDVHFKGLYQKSDESKGTGIGGYSVNKTVELHNGEIKNVSPERNSLDLFPVQIEIIIPIEYRPNPNYVKSNPYSLN